MGSLKESIETHLEMLMPIELQKEIGCDDNDSRDMSLRVMRVISHCRQFKAELDKHRWISVSERLPEKQGRYLITDGYDIVMQAQFLIPMRPDCLDGTDEDRKPEFPHITTHWMPIILP